MSKSCESVEIVQETVCIPAEHATVNGVLTYPADQSPVAAAIVVGPHPLLGGEMTNNVVSEMADGMAHARLATLRFNYTGSLATTDAGTLDPSQLNAFWDQSHTEDEAERWRDLEAATQFVRLLEIAQRSYLVAYSFGNYVTATWLQQRSRNSHGATERRGSRPAGIACISPTVNKHDLSGLAQSPIPKLVIASVNDFATDPASLKKSLGSWQNVTANVTEDHDGHFFRGHESWLVSQVLEFLEAQESPTSGKSQPGLD